MGNFIKNLSLVPKGIRYKLLISFSLMAIIPLLVCGYLIKDYIFSPKEDLLSITLILFFTILITILGMIFAKRMINPVIEMSIDAKSIAEGNFEKRIKIYEEDEIGDLGKSINKITTNIKENIQELKLYEERTKEINLEVHKKVITLSSLLKIGELIAQASKLDDVFNIILEKIAQVRENGFAAFYIIDEDNEKYIIRASYELQSSSLMEMKVIPGEGFLGSILLEGAMHVFDKARYTKEAEAFAEEFELRNFIVVPIVLRKSLVGFILCGNFHGRDFHFKDDDLELVKIFSKQLALAVENHALSEKIKILSIRDEITGLYNESYIKGRLKEEIERAILFQRPCSFIFFNIDNFEKFRKSHEKEFVENTLRRVAKVLHENTIQIAKSGRFTNDEFVMLIPEKNKREATVIAETIRKKIEESGIGGGLIGGITVSGGVSENPLDGSSAEELIAKAKAYVEKAKKEGKNSIKSN